MTSSSNVRRVIISTLEPCHRKVCVQAIIIGVVSSATSLQHQLLSPASTGWALVRLLRDGQEERESVRLSQAGHLNNNFLFRFHSLVRLSRAGRRRQLFFPFRTLVLLSRAGLEGMLSLSSGFYRLGLLVRLLRAGP